MKENIMLPLATATICGLLGGVVGGAVIPRAPSQAPVSGTGTVLSQTARVETIAQNDITQVIATASPAVVSIVVSQDPSQLRSQQDMFFQDPFFNEFFGENFFPMPNQRPGSSQPEVVAGGTGFLVSADGYVITNKHVVEDTRATYTAVLSDGREFTAEVISRDPANDLAVLKLVNTEDRVVENMPFLTVSTSPITIGQFVVAIGYALGEFENTATMGIISGKGRSIVASSGEGSEQLTSLIQTDAAINPGNSGGPLLNLQGEVIGVNTAIATRANGIGFAIQAKEVEFVLRSVKEYGKIVRPYLGVMYLSNSKDIAEQFDLPVSYGAIVQDNIQSGEAAVIPGGPAAQAGILSGDIILEVNGQQINENLELKDAISRFLPSDSVSLKVLRNGSEMTLQVSLGKREDTQTAAGSGATLPTSMDELGINGMDITPTLQARLRLPVDRGVLLYNDFANGIPGVDPKGKAGTAGFKSGDILLEVNGTPATMETITQALRSPAGTTLSFRVLRVTQEITITLTL